MELDQKELYFVRCIKPNEVKRPLVSSVSASFLCTGQEKHAEDLRLLFCMAILRFIRFKVLFLLFSERKGPNFHQLYFFACCNRPPLPVSFTR